MDILVNVVDFTHINPFWLAWNLEADKVCESLKISVVTLRQTGDDPNYWLISKAQEVKKGKGRNCHDQVQFFFLFRISSLII